MSPARDGPAGSGPSAAADAPDPVQVHLDALASDVRSARDEFVRALEEDVCRPFAQAFRAAREAHAAILEASLEPAEVAEPPADQEGGETAAEPDPPHRAWVPGGLVRYRIRVHAEVLGPLEEELRRVAVHQAIPELWEAFTGRLAGLADGLPDTVRQPEPADLYGPRAQDPLLVRGVKALVRGRRAVGSAVAAAGRGARRMVGGREAGPPPPTRLVPLRAAVRPWLTHPPALRDDQVPVRAFRLLATPVAGVERSLSTWGRSVLAAEELVRAPGALLDGELAAALSEIRSRSAQVPAVEVPVQVPEEEAAEEGVLPVSSLPSAPEAAGLTSPQGGEGDGAPAHAEAPEVGAADAALAAARALDHALDRAADTGFPDEAVSALDRGIEEVLEGILTRVRVTGTFQETGVRRRVRPASPRQRSRLEAGRERWSRWMAGAVDRIRLARSLLGLREEWDRIEAEFLAGVAEAGLIRPVERWSRARDRLATLWAQAREAPFLDPGRASETSVEEARVQLAAWADEAEAIVTQDLVEPVSPARTDVEIRRLADLTAEGLARIVRALPERIVVNDLQDDPDEPVDPGAGTREIALRELVRQTMDALRIEAVRVTPRPLLDALGEARGICAEIPQIAAFNLNSASQGLPGPDDQEGEERVELGEAVEDARALARQGLERTVDRIEELLPPLLPAWDGFTRSLDSALSGSFGEVHRRVTAEGAVQEQIADVRSAVAAWWRRTSEGIRERTATWRKRLDRAWRRGRIYASRLVRLGREAVGTSADEADSERALEILRGVPALVESLPLVYRRLFAFQAISDPALLVGRDDEFAWVRERVQAWQEGGTVPLVVTGPPGVGQTSFHNVLAATLFDRFEVVRIELDRRISHEGTLVEVLCAALGLEAGGAATLDTLGDLLARPATEDDPPVVVVLEHAEHLLFRAGGGSALMASFLSFQARASDRYLWMSSISDTAWKRFVTVQPRAASLASAFPLSVFTRDELEEFLMVRHRRSGLPVEFMPPGSANPILQRKLRRARAAEARQTVLRADFFDRIYRASRGSPAFSILIWLRATDFLSRPGWVRLRAPRPLQFGFLETLDLEGEFALMAFLEHGTLTVEELSRVMAISQEAARRTLQMLQSRMLVALAKPRARSGDPAHDDTETPRYRIPNILSQAVVGRLRDRHILY